MHEILEARAELAFASSAVETSRAKANAIEIFMVLSILLPRCSELHSNYTKLVFRFYLHALFASFLMSAIIGFNAFRDTAVSISSRASAHRFWSTLSIALSE